MTQQAAPWLTQIIRHETAIPVQPRMFVYAPPGVGKSTLAASLPKPIMIDWDRGAQELRVDRIPGPKTWDEAIALIRAIAASPSGYKTLAIDTVDPLEELLIEKVIADSGRSSLYDFKGSGESPYNVLAFHWKHMLAELDEVRAKGLMVCLLGHAIIRTSKDPQVGEYDTYTAQLQKNTLAATIRWSDIVGFANFHTARLVEGKGDKEKRVIVAGNRVLYVVRGSGFEAKNRYSMPPEIELSWKAISDAVERHRQSSAEIQTRILSMAAAFVAAGRVEVDAKAREFIAQAGGDIGKLLEIEENLKKAFAAMQAVTAAGVPAQQMAPQSPTMASVATAPVAPTTVPVEVGIPADVQQVIDRILTQAKGTPLEAKAAEYVASCVNIWKEKGDLVPLLQLEEKLQAVMKQNGIMPASNSNATAPAAAP